MAMGALGNGLSSADHYVEALSVREAELSMLRRIVIDDAEEDILEVQANLAITYGNLGRLEEALQMKREVYAGHLKRDGEEHHHTLIAALNYAAALPGAKRFKEAKSLLRKAMPVARRVLGESHGVTLRVMWNYARAVCQDPGATLDDLREGVTTLEDAERIARRVLGGAHPLTSAIEGDLRTGRTVLSARQEP